MAEEKLTAEEWARRMAEKRADALTPERRKEIAQKAAAKRWGKKPTKKKGSKP